MSERFANIFDEIKGTVSLVEEIEKSGVTVLPAGPNRMRCVCPFHPDNDPSMVINLNQEVETYKCFGCSEKGSVIDFAMKRYSIGLKDAIDYFKQGHILEFAEDVDVSKLIDRGTKRKKKRAISSMMFQTSIMFRSFIRRSPSPKKDLMKMKPILEMADEAAFLESFEYLEKSHRALKRQIKETRMMQKKLKDAGYAV